MIWLISGLHDPNWLQNIINNYNRQEIPCKLIIVENGNGIGAASKIKLPPGTVVLKSDPGPAQAINAGLEFIKNGKKINNQWFCKFDADDYYGPKYLKQIKSVIKSGVDYIGRKSLYIKNTENHLLYAESKDSGFIFHGPTIAGKVESSLDFPIVSEWGEDAEWCRDMHKLGRKFVTLPAEGFCYQRWKNYKHCWPCTDLELRMLWQVEFSDLGNIDFDVVNGIKERPIGKILNIPEINSSNFMPFRIMKERSLNFVGIRLH